MGSVTDDEFPTIDFSGLELSKPGTEAWVAARAKVMDALDTVGFFAVAFEEVDGELLGSALKSLFSVPEELRMKTFDADEPYNGYVGRLMGFGYESFKVHNPQSLDSIQAFAGLLWPQGDPSFCDALWAFSKKVCELELIVRRMILEGLGVVEQFNSFVESTKHGCRILEYSAPKGQHTMIGLTTNKDPSLLNILYQYESEGLELRTKNGEWLSASPNTFTVFTGESFEVWSNGRLKPALHRVDMTSNTETRYSLDLGSQLRNGCAIEAPGKLVDDEHPKLFKPFEFKSYMTFRFFTDEGRKAKNPLKAYCGVNGDDDDYNEVEA